jgi:putative phosphoribosyl transferase
MSGQVLRQARPTEQVADADNVWVSLRGDRTGGRAFADRRDAGRRLGQLLATYQIKDPVVIALPRGGVPVAFEVAAALDTPLDILVVHRVGVPWQPEGMGAAGEGGIRIFNASVIADAGLTDAEVDAVIARGEDEVVRRAQRYPGAQPRQPVDGRTVILVDDGLASGFIARAAIGFLRHGRAGRIVVAVPVARAETIARLGRLADEVVCLEAPDRFTSVSQFYRDSTQVSDQAVAELLALSRPESAGRRHHQEAGEDSQRETDRLAARPAPQQGKYRDGGEHFDRAAERRACERNAG